MLLFVGLFGGLEPAESRDEDTADPAQRIGLTPEALVRTHPTVLQVANGGAVAAGGLGECPLRDVGGLAESGKAFAQLLPEPGNGRCFP
ncbi:MAG TPA: hypothetical protein VJT49_05740 [Amycolatopsis sp.]|nr:hypothetical protein [Amycolatopsis sp.]HKS44608.1 hypothetical protein [Amycolatopsis sp.]